MQWSILLEPVQSFAIESVGHKLIVITGEGLRTNVTFYKMGQGQKSGKIEVLSPYFSTHAKLDQFNRVFFSPRLQRFCRCQSPLRFGRRTVNTLS